MTDKRQQNKQFIADQLKLGWTKEQLRERHPELIEYIDAATDKLQSVKLEHIKIKPYPGGEQLSCTICKTKKSFYLPKGFGQNDKLNFITAHRHEDIKSLEKGK